MNVEKIMFSQLTNNRYFSKNGHGKWATCEINSFGQILKYDLAIKLKTLHCIRKTYFIINFEDYKLWNLNNKDVCK
jgi:hypothetical protein